MKNKTWWLKFFEASVEISQLDYRRRGVVYVWLLSLQGKPVSRKMLFKTMLGDHDSRRERASLSDIIANMVESGLIIELENDRLALPTWLVSHIIDDGSGRIGDYEYDSCTPITVFLGPKSSKTDGAFLPREDSERIAKDSSGKDSRPNKKKIKREDAGSTNDALSPFLLDAEGSQAGFRGTSDQALVVLAQASERLRAIRYPSSESDPTCGSPKILRKLRSLVEEFGVDAVMEKIEIAYEHGMFCEKRGEKITLAAIVNGFEYIERKSNKAERRVVSSADFGSEDAPREGALSFTFAQEGQNGG